MFIHVHIGDGSRSGITVTLDRRREGCRRFDSPSYRDAHRARAFISPPYLGPAPAFSKPTH
jgi:hypothetical protein